MDIREGEPGSLSRHGQLAEQETASAKGSAHAQCAGPSENKRPSPTHAEVEGGPVPERLAPRPVPFMTAGGLPQPLPWPGLSIPKP